MAKKLFLGFVCLVFLVSAPICAFSSEKKAATNELSQEKINFIFNWVKEEMEYKGKVKMPEVKFVSRTKMFSIVLASKEESLEKILYSYGYGNYVHVLDKFLRHVYSFITPDAKVIYIGTFIQKTDMEQSFVESCVYFFHYQQDGDVVFDDNSKDFKTEVRRLQRKKMGEKYFKEFIFSGQEKEEKNKF